MSVTSEPEVGDELGPIDFIAVEFPGARIAGSGFQQLLTLADQGVIGILDVEFISKDATGNSGKVDISDLPNPAGFDLSVWEGASSGLLDRADVDQIAAEIEPGSVAAVIVYENLWTVNLINTWRRDGARFIADGGLSVDDVVDAIEATEPS
jgi:hypothetical protein